MINCDKCITVFSFNGRAYDRCFFDGVSIFGSDGVVATASGFEESNSFKIRIPSEEKLSVKPGDRVIFESCDVFEPENAYTVMAVKDNRRGNKKHYSLMVK